MRSLGSLTLAIALLLAPASLRAGFPDSLGATPTSATLTVDLSADIHGSLPSPARVRIVVRGYDASIVGKFEGTLDAKNRTTLVLHGLEYGPYLISAAFDDARVSGAERRAGV